MCGVGMFFTVLAVERKTILTNLLCGIIWIFNGVINFLFAPTGMFTYGISLLFWVIGSVFMALVLYIVFNLHSEKANERFKMEPF
jgi:hypothetical protein